VTDGPFAESKEVVGGFFVVLAKNLAEATEMAKECPDYALNGIVEVREVMKFDNMETESSSKLEAQNS
ncbi:MAG TPA: YciI family protein, partial [Chryseolinea sp.]|nr:YciI family protein [Chryseolinea sp.]